MTQNLKIEVLTGDISIDGMVVTNLVTKEELSTAIVKKADLGTDGKIPTSQLPAEIVNTAGIVDEGVGQYKVTFITAMPNIDYVILTGATSYSTTDLGNYGAVKMGSKTVNGFSIVCGAQNYVDVPEIYFGVTY